MPTFAASNRPCSIEGFKPNNASINQLREGAAQGIAVLAHGGYGEDCREVRKTPSWPRSWANFSLLSLYSRRNACANLHLLGQPNTFFARDGRGLTAGIPDRRWRGKLLRLLTRLDFSDRLEPIL
jgi:hypothetical protein